MKPRRVRVRDRICENFDYVAEGCTSISTRSPRMQYLGYLRRDPNAAPDTNFNGHKFWLNKLIQFKGNYIEAEMVKAFISSSEYRARFGP